MRRRVHRKKKNGFMYIRMFLCVAVICSAVVLKHLNAPIIEKITNVVSSKLQIDEAVEAINNFIDSDEAAEEVLKQQDDIISETKKEAIFDDEYYVDDATDELKKEIDEARKKAAEEKKKLSVETLSFHMSDEELIDDTKAELFRIPPPSNCSYDGKELGFKYITPLYGVITSKYGYRDHPIIDNASFHTGIDIASKKGSDISSFADGTVLDAGKNSVYGNYVLIEHKDGIKSFYGHNSKLLVRKGQKVKIGQKIAEVGSTGMSTGPHLHFEVRDGNIRLDPGLFISPETL